MNYESDIEEIILNELSYKYGIENYDTLFRYLYLRFMSIHYDIKKLDKQLFIQDFGRFLIKDELGIIEDKYKDEELKYISGFENSIGNILDNLFFSARMKSVIIDDCDKSYEFDYYINEIWLKIRKYGTNKSSKYKKDKYYKYHLIYNRLKRLNKLFDIKEIKHIRTLNEFNQGDFSTYIIYEEICERYIHASNFATNSSSSITEEELEKYIYRHLNLIEEGLKPIQRQLIIEEGRIDILAKDKDGKYVILELKIADDKQLIWQVMYYPYAIRPIIHTDKVRIVTICPFYPKHILEPLQRIDTVEIIQYIPLISNGKIEKMDFIKLK